LANLKSYISNHGLEGYIDVPGFISGETKKEILAKSDIFLFPSYCQEGCPVVILEAMVAGLAIVSTPAGAIPDIVKQNENGFIIDSRDPREFYEAIIKLIEDENLLRKIQKNNIEKAEENYETKIATRRIEALYLSI
jgi:glycosyltransferase involved in cell wall biosynthesis